jgi:myosin heavy subunit
MSSSKDNPVIQSDYSHYDKTNDEEPFEIIDGYYDGEEFIPQKKIKYDTSKNYNDEQPSESTVLKDYVEITQELDKKASDMKRLEVENSSLSEVLKQKSKDLNSMIEKFNKISDQNKELQNENKKLKVDNYNLLREKQNVEQDFAEAKASYETKIRDLELKLQAQKTHDQAEEIITSLQNQLSNKENDIRDLKQRNINLKSEASRYQSALGDVMNVRFDNDDQNNPVQLKQDILSLQRTLESYVTNLKGKIDINVKEVNVLIKQYGCQREMSQENLDKPFIKAVLQRKVIQQIFDFSKNYRKYKNGNIFSLESDIDSKTTELSNMVKKFLETRVGNDEISVSKVAPTKIRQQVYQLLGNRGFSDIITSQGTQIHNFIYLSSKNLNEIMNQYRQINDVDKKNEVEKLAQTLIRDVLRIFWFRLMVQEPIPEIKFFESNDKVNPDLMTGRWDDDGFDEICVDLCYFPLIGRDLNSNYKVITPSKIISRSINNKLDLNGEEDGQSKNDGNIGYITRFGRYFSGSKIFNIS